MLYTKIEAYVGFSLDICALSVLFITLVAVDKKFESTIKANAAITPILSCCVDILERVLGDRSARRQECFGGQNEKYFY